MSSNPEVALEINAKNEIIRTHRNRQTAIARLEYPKDGTSGVTLIWRDDLVQAGFHKSVDAFLFEEKIMVTTTLLEGLKPDVVPASAPAAPAKHKMQGDLTPAYLEWLMKWKPIEFQVMLGVKCRILNAGEAPPKDPRDLWQRADVIRTDTRPTEESRGGQYISTRFTMKDQIIARRQSHLTFTEKEIYLGDTAADQAEPYTDPYADLSKMDKRGEIEIVSVKNSAASAGSIY